LKVALCYLNFNSLPVVCLEMLAAAILGKNHIYQWSHSLEEKTPAQRGAIYRAAPLVSDTPPLEFAACIQNNILSVARIYLGATQIIFLKKTTARTQLM
jgi:hypothetical protein